MNSIDVAHQIKVRIDIAKLDTKLNRLTIARDEQMKKLDSNIDIKAEVINMKSDDILYRKIRYLYNKYAKMKEIKCTTEN